MLNEQHVHQEETMKALSVEQRIFEGKQEVKKLFQFISDHATESTA